ncbi:hypothetical protein GCK32_007382 [Trichostrongylus colubriformis]|uniref:Uncharacterized protein n=1 Tax=Trichostrongylus colubriformis TaxID=6319 RepID=A0AAN8G5W8_TRICO
MKILVLRAVFLERSFTLLGGNGHGYTFGTGISAIRSHRIEGPKIVQEKCGVPLICTKSAMGSKRRILRT